MGNVLITLLLFYVNEKFFCQNKSRIFGLRSLFDISYRDIPCSVVPSCYQSSASKLIDSMLLYICNNIKKR